MSPQIGAREISCLLAQRIEILAAELFPVGKRGGPEWKCGSLAGEAGKSLSICLRGPKAGVWSDFAGGQSGDALDLVAHALYRGDTRQALAWASRWLGLGNGSAVAAPSRPSAPPARSASPPPDTVAAARRLWMEARAAAGSAVERYLKARGLQLPTGVECIRFHPSCPLGPATRYPAMLALMTDPTTGEPTGIHRTPLLPDGTGRPDGVTKMMMGRAGIIRLAGDGYDNGRLGIAEGVESALSVMQWGGWHPVWAACTAGGIERFPVLAGVEVLTVFADHDIAGIASAQACAREWKKAGREVKIITPKQFNDWNDVAGGVAG